MIWVLVSLWRVPSSLAVGASLLEQLFGKLEIRLLHSLKVLGFRVHPNDSGSLASSALFGTPDLLRKCA